MISTSRQVAGKRSVPWRRFLPCSPASPIANRPRAFAIISGCSRTPFGLLTCDHDYGYRDRQWNYPVGWAPLHWIAYHGLKDYGYKEDASRIAMKWIDLNLHIWKETGKFYEKYDVVVGTQEVLTDRYSQEGFGWTNAVFHALVVALRNDLT